MDEVYLAIDPESVDGIYVFSDDRERDRFFDAWATEPHSVKFKSDEPVIRTAAHLLATFDDAS